MTVYSIGKDANEALRRYWDGGWGWTTLEGAERGLAEERASDPSGEHFIYRITVEVLQS